MVTSTEFEGPRKIAADKLRNFTCPHVPLNPGTAIGQPEACPSCIVEAVWPLAYRAGREDAARDIEDAMDAARGTIRRGALRAAVRLARGSGDR